MALIIRLRGGSVMTAHMIVRATVADSADREAFDRWYGEDHMPQAIAAFHPQRSWRSWSTVDTRIHYAFYEFADMQQIEEMTRSHEFSAMVAEFTSLWDGKVTRERDLTVTVQVLTD